MCQKPATTPTKAEFCAIAVITLGEASYGALSRKWSARRTAEMLTFYADSFGVVELGRAVAVEYGRLRPATEASAGRLPATTCGSPHQRRPTGCRS
jgi:predicted nucleic acid-binding protein